jgi:hypothetical protein
MNSLTVAACLGDTHAGRDPVVGVGGAASKSYSDLETKPRSGKIPEANMNRRGFISATGAMLGTRAIAGVVSFPLISALPPATEPALSNGDDVRAQFNLSPNKINMSCYWHASHPKPVRQAIEQHKRGLDECPSETSGRAHRALRPLSAPRLRNILTLCCEARSWSS